MNKQTGILLPISSLPAKDIGNFGKVAYEFIDQLQKAKQTIWQVLPIGPTIIHDSPFYSPSAFAINPNYIDLEDLLQNPNWKTLEPEELEKYYEFFQHEHPNKINYGLLWEQKKPLLETAFQRFIQDGLDQQKDYTKFKEEQKYWLDNYIYFMAIKEIHLQDKDKTTWFDWDEEFKNKEIFDKNLAFVIQYDQKSQQGQKSKPRQKGQRSKQGQKSQQGQTTLPKNWTEEKLEIYKDICDYAEMNVFLQWVAWSQWNKLKEYANSKNIIIIGDCPIYVAPDSADVWANQTIFKLDEDGNQTCYAGVPPDYFSPVLGQFWGNPIYQWEKPNEPSLNPETLDWWCKRLMHQLSLFDKVRIDHFRGFAGYWEIPADKSTTKDEQGNTINTAQYGEWKKGPGIQLFKNLAKKMNLPLNQLPLIAEDLGVITDDVIELKNELQAPGMGVYEFVRWHDLCWKTKNGQMIPITKEILREVPFIHAEEWERLYYMESPEVPFNSHEFLPRNVATTKKYVFYPGTHDNETLMGIYQNLQKDEVAAELFLRYQDFLNKNNTEKEVHWKVISALHHSPEIQYSIIAMQDILGLPNIIPGTDIQIRMNEPNKVGQWRWKMGGDQIFTDKEIQKLSSFYLPM